MDRHCARAMQRARTGWTALDCGTASGIALCSLQVVAGSESSGTAMNDDMTWRKIQEDKIVLFEANFDESDDTSRAFKQLARRILALQLFLSFVRAAECTTIGLFAYAGIKTPYPPQQTKTILEPLTGSASLVTEPLAAHLSVTYLPGSEDVSVWHQHEAQALCLLSDLMRKRRVCLLTRYRSRIWPGAFIHSLELLCPVIDSLVAERRRKRVADDLRQPEVRSRAHSRDDPSQGLSMWRGATFGITAWSFCKEATRRGSTVLQPSMITNRSGSAT